MERMMTEISTAQQLCGSAARTLQRAAARREASRETRRGSAGPVYERASAATASWPAALVPLNLRSTCNVLQACTATMLITRCRRTDRMTVVMAAYQKQLGRSI